MSDAQLAEAVDTLRSDLRAEFDDLDAEVEVETGFRVRALHPPERRPSVRVRRDPGLRR